MKTYFRRNLEQELTDALSRAPVVAILGPRQCGKSTLAKECLKQKDSIYLDLQNRVDRNKLSEPELFVELYRDKLICLDEIQLMPEFFRFLRSEVDANRTSGRFLILGSASRELIKQSSESLAGRIAYLQLTPLLINEIEEPANWQTHWIRGGFPDSFLSRSESASLAWRNDFIQTFLNRDIPSLGFNIPASLMERLWRLLAHYHGQTINYSKLANCLDITTASVKKYLFLLEQTYMIRLLQPMEVNIKKRIIKAPKVYLRDSGILHKLLDIESFDQLLSNPHIGSSWEGYCIEHIINKLSGWRPSFLRTTNGAEVDLVMEKGSQTLFFEFKMSKAPKLQRGFMELKNDINPRHSWVISPVDSPYPLKNGVTVSSLFDIIENKNLGSI